MSQITPPELLGIKPTFFHHEILTFYLFRTCNVYSGQVLWTCACDMTVHSFIKLLQTFYCLLHHMNYTGNLTRAKTALRNSSFIRYIADKTYISTKRFIGLTNEYYV